MKGGGIENRDVAARLLGPVKGDVGGREHRARCHRVREVEVRRGSERRAEMAQATVVMKRLADAARNLGRQRLGAGKIDTFPTDDDEFIAPDPRRKLLIPGRFLQDLGDMLEDFVTGIVAERVIDVFEVVEVDADQRAGGVLRVLQRVVEGPAVRQPRQRIVIGLVARFLLGGGQPLGERAQLFLLTVDFRLVRGDDDDAVAPVHAGRGQSDRPALAEADIHLGALHDLLRK